MCLFLIVFEYFYQVVWEWMDGRLVVEEVCFERGVFPHRGVFVKFFGKEQRDRETDTAWVGE